MSKELIRKIFERLPPAERKMPAVIIDGKTFTWEEAWVEVRDDKPLATKIQKEIEKIKKNMENKMKKLYLQGKEVPQDVLNILIARINAMPPNIKIAVMGQVLSRDDILREIHNESAIGKELLEMELRYYADLIRD